MKVVILEKQKKLMLCTVHPPSDEADSVGGDVLIIPQGPRQQRHHLLVDERSTSQKILRR